MPVLYIIVFIVSILDGLRTIVLVVWESAREQQAALNHYVIVFFLGGGCSKNSTLGILTVPN